MSQRAADVSSQFPSYEHAIGTYAAQDAYQCHSCGAHVVPSTPADYERCPHCNAAIPSIGGTQPWAVQLQAFLSKQQQDLRSFMRKFMPHAPDAPIPMPDYTPVMTTEITRDEKEKYSVPVPTDQLPSPIGKSFRVLIGTSVTPTLVAGRDRHRRSLIIANYGLPAIGGRAAIPASNAFLAFDESEQENDAFWLPANATVSMDCADQIYGVGDGTNTTVLHCIRVGV